MKTLILGGTKLGLQMASKLTELYREVKGLRRDVEEIKEMLIPEVSPTEADRKAVVGGRKEYARGEMEEWSEVRKRVAER
jgi:hypothetical protein